MRTKIAPFLFVGFVILFSAGCSHQPTPPLPAITPVASALATAAATQPIAAPTETEMLAPEQMTEQAAPTPTLWPTPTALPDSWKTYTSAALGVTFRYPDNWQAESDTRYSGEDGFFELATLASAASEGTLCMLEANRHKPDRYGPQPQIVEWGNDKVERACLILPSNDQPAATRQLATALLWYPAGLKPGTVLVVHTNRSYLGSLLETLKFPGAGTPTPSSGVYNSPACDTPPAQATALAGLPAGLTVNEHAIANAACDPFSQFDGFQARIPQTAQEAQAKWRERFRQNLEAANQTLAPFGYRLVERSTTVGALFDVYHGEAAVQTGQTRFWPVSVSGSGADFALVVQDAYNSLPPVLVSKATTATWQADSAFTYFPIPPVFVGDDLTWVEFEQADPWPPTRLHVERGGQTIYTLTTVPPGPGGGPVRGLWAWNGHWVLDLDGVAVMDGEILNDKLGYDEIFQWQLLGGKPFYFFRQGKHIGLSYDGQTLPYRYDDVIHGFLCCDPAVYNIQSSSSGVWFYARRDGVWDYVEITADQPLAPSP